MKWQELLVSNSNSIEEIEKALLASRINRYITFDKWQSISEEVLNWLTNKIEFAYVGESIWDLGTIAGQCLNLIWLEHKEIKWNQFRDLFYSLFYQHGFVYSLNYPFMHDNRGAALLADEHHIMQNIFENIYANNKWEYGSGYGSLPENTERYREVLSHLIHQADIKSVIDYGCGDWQFSRSIIWDDQVDSYIGVDISRAVVEKNQALYSNHVIQFQTLTHDWIPADVDLIICKDVFHHLPNYYINKLMKLFLQHAKYVLITTDATRNASFLHNTDCYFGGYRAVNLAADPLCYQGYVLLETTEGLQNYTTYKRQKEVQNDVIKQTILFKRGE